MYTYDSYPPTTSFNGIGKQKKGFKVNSIYSRAVLKPTDAYWGYVRQTTNIPTFIVRAKIHWAWAENL